MKAQELRRWESYFEHRNNGESVEASARKSRLPPSTAWRFEKNDQTGEGSGGLEAAAILGIQIVAGNLVAQALKPEAKRALEDFAYFRRRYMGRESTPWQTRAAAEILRASMSDEREYEVMNEPPGSGKSTLFTHDIPCWLIAKDRSIRIQIGSRTERQARMYVARIKRTLERDAPLRADADSIIKGIAFDAEACMMDDFGAFKPEGRTEMWRAEGLVVRSIDGVQADDKEPTVSAWGMDSGFLGGRFDVVIWDDLVDRKNMKTAEAKQELRDWFDTDAETRLEPGGLLLLQGQRISHDDLYRTCLDKKTLDDTPKYRHVKFKAHDESKCTGNHENLEPWPASCLLDPHRLPWKLLETVANTNPRSYAVTYQQEDGDVVNGLVERTWIEGGTDSKGFPSPGCLDRERGLFVYPAQLQGRGWSIVTVDPSPSEFWGVIWWLYDGETEERHIIDLHRKRMNPEDFLTRDEGTMLYHGLLQDLYVRSLEIGIPLDMVVFEANAAQGWFLRQPHVQTWMQLTGISIVPHTTTGRNKNDLDFGLESTGDLYRRGLIRIPWGDIHARGRVQFLIDEAIRYPDHDTTDLIMSVWFGKLAVEQHYVPKRFAGYQMQRPDWMKVRGRGLAHAGR